MSEISEKVLAIGNPVPIVAVLTESSSPKAELPTVVLLNSGLVHKPGSCRLSVKIARKLATSGFQVVRFDLPSIGDSYERISNLSPEDADVDYCRECLDYLQKELGAKEFVLYGLCSGGFISFETACLDSRVVGVCTIDGYCYRYLTGGLKVFYRNSLNFKKLYKALLLSLKAIAVRSYKVLKYFFIKSGKQYLLHTTWENFPSRREFNHKLSILTKRNVKMLTIFTSLRADFSGQLEEGFKKNWNPCLFRAEYLLNALHIIPEPEQQKKVLAIIDSWAKSEFHNSQTVLEDTQKFKVRTL